MANEHRSWTEIDQASADLGEVLADVAESDSDEIYGDEEEEDLDEIYGDDGEVEGDLDEIYGDEGEDDDDPTPDDVDDDASESAASVVAAVEDAIPSSDATDADLSFDEAMANADLESDLPARVAGEHWTEVLGDAADRASEEASNADALGEGERAAYAVFGELFSRSPSFRAYAEKLVAASRPMVSKVALKKARDWQLDFGPASMPAGEVTTITVRPQCLFRGEKILANDTANPAGTGTRIVSVTVGQKIQRPMGGARGSLTRFFQANALANGVLFDTAQPWCDVAVTVSFVSACTFDLSVFGKAVVDR